MTTRVQLDALVARALDPGASLEEARTSAYVALKRARDAGYVVVFAKKGEEAAPHVTHVPASWGEMASDVARAAAAKMQSDPEQVARSIEDFFATWAKHRRRRPVKPPKPRKTR